MMKNKLMIKLSIWIATFLIFFGYLKPNQYIILGSIATIIIIYSIKTRFFKINMDDILWIMCIFMIGLSLCYSLDRAETVKYFIVMLIIIMIKIVYSNTEEYKYYIINLFYISSMIHVIATIVYIILPNMMIKICAAILPYQAYSDNIQFYNMGSIAGITGQTGMNAFYISIYIAIVYSRFICRKNNKVKNLILLIIGFIALFLTAKRGPLLTNIIAMLIITVIFGNINIRSFIPKIVACTVIIIIGISIVNRIPQTSIMIEKFTTFSGGSDITNGRRDLWSEAIEHINKSPIIGIGAYATPKLIGEMTHNIYVQIMLELGIFGLAFFIIAMLKSLTLSFRNYWINRNKDNILSNKKDLFSISIYIQVYFLIYGMSGNPLYGITFLAPYFIAISLSRN